MFRKFILFSQHTHFGQYKSNRQLTRLTFLLFCFCVFFMLTTETAQAQVEFVENKGQWNEQVKFMSKAGDGSFYLRKTGYTVTQYHPDDVTAVTRPGHAVAEGKIPGSNQRIRAHAYAVEFEGASPAAIWGEKPIPTVNNYFIGNDPSKWAAGVQIFQAVYYKNVYPQIDIRYYIDNGSRLKYDFIVHPGGDYRQISMTYTGVNSLKLRKRELIIGTSLGESRELEPYSYQLGTNGRSQVETKYVLRGNTVTFQLKNYDPTKTLIIDPTQVFFSYSGSTADNWGFTATYGKDGSFYGGGIAHAQGFPANTGSFDQTFGGEYDISIMKLSPDGKNRIYATYIGGSRKDQPHSLIEDSQGNLVLAGRSNSSDYPVTELIKTDPKAEDYDIVVTKLNATGSALIGSIKIGGAAQDGVNIVDQSQLFTQSLKRNYGDDARSEVLVDANDYIYMAGSTSSKDFPVTSGVVQNQLAGKQDAVLLKIDPTCNNLIFATYLGGADDDAGYVLGLKPDGNIYVAGGTASADMNGISTSGVVKPTFSQTGSNGDPADGFILEVNANASAIVRGTYIGTGKADQIYGIALDNTGAVYIMGTSEGNMPVINANYSVSNAKQFICKLQPDLSDYVYATVFGAPNSTVPNISPTAFLVDRCENVYVSGWGGKANTSFIRGSSTLNMPTTPNAIKGASDPSGSDFYFFVLEKNAVSQLYGTFFGQDDTRAFGDHVDGGTSRFDRNGIIYQSICANCGRNTPFPGNPGSWSSTNQAVDGGKCNIGMLKIEMDFTGVKAAFQTIIDGIPNDSVGCAPLTVTFKDTLNRGKLYYWNFGDGASDTTTTPTTNHVYQNAGTYRVRLIAVDSATCNIADTSYRTVTAGVNRITPNFDALKIPPCENLGYQFVNLSTAVNGIGSETFVWDFGDGSAPVEATINTPVTHTYAGPGTYSVSLSVANDVFCNNPADTVKTVRLSPEVKAAFATAPRGCAPHTARFQNNSLGGLRFEWDFGDGTTATAEAPTHVYNNPGTYTVTMRAFDSTSCNKEDVTTFTIRVSAKPVTAFTYNPPTPQENTATNFTNTSTGAASYLWRFGDGDSSTMESPSHIFPSTGQFSVCLEATNSDGCADTVCTDVSALIVPILDVPSAFTPGKPGPNSTIKVEGFGIKSMKWTIYNRWGQKVFEADSKKSAWDGTWKGKPQPVDVYTYTLEAIFSDGSKVQKTGDITLIR